MPHNFLCQAKPSGKAEPQNCTQLSIKFDKARCLPSKSLALFFTTFTYTQLLGTAKQDPLHDAWARPWGEGLPGLCTKEDRDDRELLCAMGLSQMEIWLL